MKKKRGYLLVPLALLLVLTLVTTAFGIDEGDVQSAVTESSKEEVAGNIFIWFLCAIGFLKISQKIDSFMAAIGINTARTGGSMLAELMIAGKSIAGAAGHSLGGMFHHGGSAFSGAAKAPAAGSAYVSNQVGHGVIGMAQQAAANKATAATTERASGLSGVVGNKMFQSSLKNGGQFSTDVTHSVAMGNINQMGTMTGATAAAALAGYMGYTAAAMDEGSAVIDEADNSENGVTLDGGGAGAQPPVQGAVPRTPEERPGETGVPPVQPAGAHGENMAGQRLGKDHSNVIPIVPVSPAGTSFTHADLQGGAASPYTPMGMDAGASIPREPAEVQPIESVPGAVNESASMPVSGDTVMNNTPEDNGFQPEMQFASVVGMDGGTGSESVAPSTPAAAGTDMKTDAVGEEAIPSPVAGVQGEPAFQSTTSGEKPVIPMSAERMPDAASGGLKQTMQSASTVGVPGGSIPGKYPEGKKTPASSSAVTGSAGRVVTDGDPITMQSGAEVFHGSDSAGIPSDPTSAAATQGAVEKSFEPQMQAASIVGTGGIPVPGKNSGIEKTAGVHGNEIRTKASVIQTEEAKSSQVGAGEHVKTVPMTPPTNPDTVGGGIEPQTHTVPVVGTAQNASQMAVGTAATAVKSATAGVSQRGNSVLGGTVVPSPMAANAQGSSSGVKSASPMVSTPIEKKTDAVPETDKTSAVPSATVKEDAAASTGMSQNATIPLAPGGTAETRQGTTQAQSITQSAVTSSAGVHKPEKSGAAHGMDISRTPAQSGLGRTPATPATEAVAKQQGASVVQAGKPENHFSPTMPEGAAIITAGAAMSGAAAMTQGFASGTDVHPQLGVAERAGNAMTDRTLEDHAGGSQSLPYQNPTGGIELSRSDSPVNPGTDAGTVIQMQSPGVHSGAGVKPMSSKVLAEEKTTTQKQEMHTEANTTTSSGTMKAGQNAQPVSTSGIPTRNAVPQEPVSSGVNGATAQTSAGSLKEMPIPMAVPSGAGGTDMKQHAPVSHGTDFQQEKAHRTTSEAGSQSNPVMGGTPGMSQSNLASAHHQGTVSTPTGAAVITSRPAVRPESTPSAEKAGMKDAAAKTAAGGQSPVLSPQNGQPMVDHKPEKAGNAGRSSVMTSKTVSTEKAVGNQIPTKPETAGKNMAPVHQEGIAGRPVQSSVPGSPVVNAQGKPAVSKTMTANKTIEKGAQGKTERPVIQREATKPAMDGQRQPLTPPSASVRQPREHTPQPDNRQSGGSAPQKGQSPTPVRTSEPLKVRDVRTEGKPVSSKVQAGVPPTSRVQTGDTASKAGPPHRAPEVKMGRAPSTPVSVSGAAAVTQKAPTYTKVEIGGGRITGVETPADGGKSRPFAMYSTKQYTEPKGPHEVVKTVDGESWYKQYAQPAVQKTPKEVTEKGIRYDQKIVDQLPDAPRRKDRI